VKIRKGDEGEFFLEDNSDDNNFVGNDEINDAIVGAIEGLFEDFEDEPDINIDIKGV
jgi:hypothetical protein